jgi:uncharacterized protein (TIGR03437 family)
MVAGLLAVPVAAQTYNHFDNSANATLHGNYFVREVLLTNLNPDGTVGDAISAIGTVAFDGVGGYTFNGTVMESNPSGGGAQPTTRSITGSYGLAPNGFLWINSIVGTYVDLSGNTRVDVAWGGAGVAGPNAFVASTTESPVNYDLLIGIPMNASATNASFNGTYNAAYLDFLQADVTKVRNATFPLMPDGQGNLGNVAVTGYAANLNSTAQSQTAANATYSLLNLTATGGTMNFGVAASLITGSKAFMISPDGTLVLGGSLNGFDILVGTPAVTSATDAMYKGLYFLGALEDDASSLVSQSQSSIDTLYGSASVTGAGEVLLNHMRIDPGNYYPYDYTDDDYYSVPANGMFQPTFDSDQYTLGANGKVVIMSGQDTWYSLMVGLQAPDYTGSGVYLNPLGIVNTANYAPATNPVAPLEMVALFGTGMASADFDATTLPIPTQTPDHVEVLINGTPVPIFRVRASLNPQLIYVLVPTAISPANGVYYATFQVVNNGVSSNSVTLYTNYTAPGVFAVSQGGIGDAAALHADAVGSLVTPANPAKLDETVELFVDGLGSVTPPITPDGAGALSVSPFNLVDATTTIYMDGWNSTLPFVGMAPGYTGLYQVNVTIPGAASVGDWYLYVNAFDPVGLDGGLAVETTMNVAAAASSAGVTGLAPAAHAAAVRRPLRATHHGIPAVNGQKPASHRLPRAAQ